LGRLFEQGIRLPPGNKSFAYRLWGFYNFGLAGLFIMAEVRVAVNRQLFLKLS